jgi:hypothetical protein
MDEARGEEAAQSGQQQECILSGGVYLRHRLKDNLLPSHSDILYHKQERRTSLAFGRARNFHLLLNNLNLLTSVLLSRNVL